MDDKYYHADGRKKEIDLAFFKKISSPDHHKTYQNIAKAIIKHLDPASVIDYGCGCGWVMYYLENQGVKEVFGIEYDEVVKDLVHEDILPKIRFASLTEPLEIEDRYDLAVCFEVAEHIDAQYADMIVENLCKNSNKVLFSAAYPGQGGYGHVNEQPMSYWVEKFKKHGFEMNTKKSNLVREKMKRSGVKKWYHENSRLFVKTDS